MAYIKYKEMTRYYNFSKELNLNELPKDVYAYIEKDEQILIAYSSGANVFLLTSSKIIIYDVTGFIVEKETVHFFPFITVSSTAIELRGTHSAILLTMESGYQVRLNFKITDKQEQERFRRIYMYMVDVISKKRVSA